MTDWGNDSRVKFINRIVKQYDRELFAQRNNQGIILVLRRGKRFIANCIIGEVPLLTLVESPHFVLALTDTWAANGKPRDWGAEFVLGRLRDMDLHEDEALIEKMDAANERIDEIKAKDFRNMNESYLIDNRSMFKKAFSDINTSTLSKRERRKELQEKRGK